MTEYITTHPELPTCTDCGYVHVRSERATCTAHKRRFLNEGDEAKVRVPCFNYPIQGGLVCKFHGGGAAQVRAKAHERKSEQAMDRVLKLAVAEVDPRWAQMSPDEQLLQEVGRSAQIVEWLAQRVAELKVPNPEDQGPLEALVGVDEDGEPLINGQRFVLYGPNHQGDGAPHILWAMLNQERDRHARMCKLAIDAGISERLVRLAESQAQAVVSLIITVLNGLGLDPRTLDKARRLAAVKLRELGPTPVLDG